MAAVVGAERPEVLVFLYVSQTGKPTYPPQLQGLSQVGLHPERVNLGLGGATQGNLMIRPTVS